MHSFVARLRSRAISQTTTTSTRSEEPLPDTPDTPTFLQSPPSIADSHPIIDRKIHPQVHELLESYSHEEHTDTGLRPPPVRHRTPLYRAAIEETSETSDSARHAEDGSPSPADTMNAGRGSLARISRRLASSTPWSTFGKTASRTSSDRPPSSRRFHFGSVDTFAIPRTSQSSRSLATHTLDSSVSVDHLRRPSRASEASSWLPQSSHPRSHSLSAIVQPPPSSSPPTTSSGRTSVKRSVTSRSSFSAQSQTFSVHTPVAPFSDVQPSSASPLTFGPSSPPLRLTDSETPYASSPPPLAIPDDHETNQELTSDSQPILRDSSNTITTRPLRHWSSTLQPKTFPPRRRSKTVDGRPDENVMIFPIASERRVRKYTSVPGVRHIFQQEQQPPPTPKLSRKRSSARSSRRSSADWSSRQATFGVTSNTFGEYGWPAEVSREMIRLSLGDAPERQVDSKRPQRVRTTSAKSGIIQRGHNVPHAIEVAGRPCPPLPSPNPLPPNTEGNSESGDKSSWPHHFQDHYPVSHKSGGAVEGQSSMSVRNGAELSTLREEGDDSRQAATLPRAAGGTRGYRKSILRQSSSLNTQGSEAGPSSLQSTPTSSPYPSRRPSLRSPARHASEPTLSQVPETPTSNKGKRKAEDLDVTPPDLRFTQHTTFVIPTDHRRTHHQSEPSRAPSAYQHKRVRLSSQSPAPSPTPTPSRPGSSLQNANITGTPSSRISNPPPSPANRALSRAASTRSMQPSFASGAPPSAAESRRDRRRSLSEISIPIGAIVAPQPPSLSRSSTYHMRDPRRPPRIQPTSWVPHTKSEDEEASPIHAWLFYTAFVLFPLWWIAAFLPIPRTRHVGGSDTEKAVTLDDPQIEHDARSWRFRCRIMGCVSFLTYIPFIVLVAVFASR